jgi:hypothetical protein
MVCAASLVPAAAQDGEYPHGDFDGDCLSCHSEEQWTPVEFGGDWRHPASFPLRGAHQSSQCSACHVTLDFSRASSECVDCHDDAHRGELGTDCAECHTPRNFLDRSEQLARHRTTRLPLSGAHAVLDCEACHRPQPQGALTWVGTPSDCAACHIAEYQSAVDPNHVAAGFPTECQQCHRPTLWEQARFDHRNTGFHLQGEHRRIDCSACHSSGYSGTPTDCYACHQDDYLATKDPNHQLAGFPTDCSLCHGQSTFAGGSFREHDSLYFPIYSGRHDGTWAACSDCHTQPGNFAVFSCFLCHSSEETDDDHRDVPDYIYDSARCYDCHPTGSAEGR